MAIRPTTDDLLALGDFQRTNMWKISMIRAPIAVPINTEDFNLRCRTSSTPKFTQQAIEAYVRANRVYDSNVVYPDGTLTLSFIETVDTTIRVFGTTWMRMCKERTTTLRDLCADFRLVELDNQENEVFEHFLGWSFPEDFDTGELAGNEAGAQIQFPTMTLKYNTLKQTSLVA